MRWEQLKGSSWASEQTRENHCVVHALYKEVSWASQDGEAWRVGALQWERCKLLTTAMHG